MPALGSSCASLAACAAPLRVMATMPMRSGRGLVGVQAVVLGLLMVWRVCCLLRGWTFSGSL